MMIRALEDADWDGLAAAIKDLPQQQERDRWFLLAVQNVGSRSDVHRRNMENVYHRAPLQGFGGGLAGIAAGLIGL